MIATTSLPQLPGKPVPAAAAVPMPAQKMPSFLHRMPRAFSIRLYRRHNVSAVKSVSKSVRFCTGRVATSRNRICMPFVERTTSGQIVHPAAFSLWLPRKSLHGKALSLEQHLTKTCIFRSPSPKMKSSLLPCGVQNMCRVTRNWFTGMHSTA